MKQRLPAERRLCITVAGLLACGSPNLRAAGSALNTIASAAPGLDLHCPPHYFAAALRWNC